MDELPDLTIGEVARRAGVATSSIRYYERIELLPAPERLGRALLERTRAMKGWLEVAQECGCATPAECALVDAPDGEAAAPDLALRLVKVAGKDCRRPV